MYYFVIHTMNDNIKQGRIKVASKV